MTDYQRHLLILEWKQLDSLISGLAAQMSEAEAQGDEAKALRKERALMEAQGEQSRIGFMLAANSLVA